MRLIALRVELDPGSLAEPLEDLQPGFLRGRGDPARGPVALAMAALGAAPRAAGGAREAVDRRLRGVAGGDRRRPALPCKEQAVALDQMRLAERAAVAGQRVDVPDRHPIRGEVAAEAAQRGDERVLAGEVVQRVVEARHGIEAAQRRQLAHVEQVQRDSRRLAGGLAQHLRRHVGAGDRVAALDQREEALAGAAADVEHPPAAAAMARRQLVDRREPALVVVAGGQRVVGRRERVVAFCHPLDRVIGSPDRRHHKARCHPSIGLERGVSHSSAAVADATRIAAAMPNAAGMPGTATQSARPAAPPSCCDVATKPFARPCCSPAPSATTVHSPVQATPWPRPSSTMPQASPSSEPAAVAMAHAAMPSAPAPKPPAAAPAAPALLVTRAPSCVPARIASVSGRNATPAASGSRRSASCRKLVKRKNWPPNDAMKANASSMPAPILRSRNIQPGTSGNGERRSSRLNASTNATAAAAGHASRSASASTASVAASVPAIAAGACRHAPCAATGSRGSARCATTSPSAASGTVAQRTLRQPGPATRKPPMTEPNAPPNAPAAPQTAIAPARARPSNARLRTASVAGKSSALPRPCPALAATSAAGVVAIAPAAALTTWTASPARKTLRGPSASDRRPPSRSSPPKPSAYALTTHCSAPSAKPSDRFISGSAT